MAIQPCEKVFLKPGSSQINVEWGAEAADWTYKWLCVCLLSGSGANASIVGSPLYKQLRYANALEVPVERTEGQGPELKKQWLLCFRSDGNNVPIADMQALLTLGGEERRKYVKSEVVGPKALVKYMITETTSTKTSELKKIQIETESDIRIADGLLRYGYRIGGVDVRYDFPDMIPAGRKEWPVFFVPKNVRVELFDAASGKISIEELSQPTAAEKIRRLFNRLRKARE